MSAYSDAVVADSPVAYWRFGESSGTVAEPAVGAKHGTYNNCTLGEPGLLPIDAATSVYFNGTSAYITTPGNAGVSQPPLTVEFWVKPDQDAMIGTFDSAPNATNVIRNYDGDRFEWWNASPYISYNFIGGTKYHVVLVCVMDAAAEAAGAPCTKVVKT